MRKNTAKHRGFFVTGTNTEVGKTYVASLIIKRLVKARMRVGVYKPVASGCIKRGDEWQSEDAERLWIAAGKPNTLDAVTPQHFTAQLAPNVAARAEGRRVDSQLLRDGLRAWDGYEITLVEGVGGLMSPISDEDLVVDLAVDFGLPMIIVVANELGCINQTLQTIDVAKRRNLVITGIVLNAATQSQDESCGSNQSEIERWTDTPILATIRWGDTDFDLAPLQCWLPE